VPDIDSIRALCRSLPEVTEGMPWPDDLCFKVRGKIFVGMALSDGRFPRVTLKCRPDHFHDLLEIDGISVAPYVGRYHWVQLANSNVLPDGELEELIRQAYALVVAKAPKPRRQPRKKSAHKKGNRPPKKKTSKSRHT
jgi:predicted DNA-binding protein (MmcQ/YjbR family)